MNTAPTPSASRERIERAIMHRLSPFPELTMELLTQQLNQFRVGNLSPAARTWEIMLERDGDLSAVVEKRLDDAARCDWEIFTLEESAEAEAHRDALRYFYNNLRATAVLDQDEMGGVPLLVRQMLLAHAHRYSVHEILLRPDNPGRREVTATFHHYPTWFFESRRGRLRFLQQTGDWDGVPMLDGQWLRTVGRGYMRQCAVAYLIKWMPLTAWVLFANRFGIPGIHGKTDAPIGSKEWNEFAAALTSFANDWVTLTNRDADVSLVEAKAGGSGTLPFEGLVQRADKIYGKLWRGGDLSTESQSQSVGANLQDEEKDLLRAGDCELVTGTLQEQVDRPVIRYLFGVAPKAYFRLLQPKRRQIDQDTKSAEFLVRHGARISLATAAERLGWPLADETEQSVLTAPAAPAMVAGGAAADPLGLANEADALVAAGRQQLADAVAADLQPLLRRLAAIDAIADPEVRRERLQLFLLEFDQLSSDILADPASAAVLAKVQAAAVVNGLTAPQTK